tara:strand:- start:859 stop:1188 length:330 start_codon:yes stop_codon:yes gene_type:complete
MKFLAVFLSLFTVLLSSYPCCQEKGSCSETFLADSCGHDDSEESPHDKEKPCSPFYTCGRCPGFTIAYENLLNISIMELDLKMDQVPYQEFVSEEVYFLSLKPPRSFEV